MKGAREYASLITTGQHGRLYFVSGSHARGKTFRILVLPKGETAIPNGPNNPPLNPDAVEVYGVIAGHPGWTEKYGWTHEGPWQEDFERYVAERRAEKKEKDAAQRVLSERRRLEEEKRVAHLLADYRSNP